ncbi:Leucine-rich repeat [Trinorchestia longiramus]|nr:Leucine-rich repeat [Trinorchestia longiramus]
MLLSEAATIVEWYAARVLYRVSACAERLRAGSKPGNEYELFLVSRRELALIGWGAMWISSTSSVSATCGDGWFECNADAGVCLQHHNICDLVADCSDGEDETDCVPTESDGEELRTLLQRPVTPAHGTNSCNLTGVPSSCSCKLGSAISCRGAQLLHLPGGIDSRVLDLFLVNNSLNLSVHTFQGFGELRSLHLGHNDLTSLPDGAFAALPKLTEL